MKAKDLLMSSAFMLSLSLIVSLLTNFAGVFPDQVFTSSVRSNLTVLILAIMMTLSLSRYSFKNLGPKGNMKSIARAIFMGLILSSIIPLIGYFLLKDTTWSTEAAGLVFIAATPFAASVAPLTYILRGDMEHAARGTIYVYVAALLWIPFVIWLCLGESVSMSSVALTVVEIIGVPLVVSRLLTKLNISREFMSIFLNCCIFFLVWLSVSSTSFPSNAWILLAFIVIAALRTFFLGNMVEVVEKRAGIPWGQRVADILMTSYKNKGIAIAMCMAVMAPLGLASTAMVAIATSIIIEICWVIFMDSVLFSRKRMERELAADGQAVSAE
ncbi:MAG: Na+-dependent transporter [Thermoplasmata archaeon]|nr:Na+-dependent transporter [Thermoplasmata archaeon]